MRHLIIVLLATTSMASAQTDYEITSSEWPETNYVAYWRVVSQQDIGNFFQLHLPPAFQAVVSAGLAPGPASGLYWSFDEETSAFEMEAAVSFAGGVPGDLPDDYQIVNVPASDALSMDYYGPYENLPQAHEAFDAYLAKEEMQPAFLVVEEYITDPTTEPDSSKWLTKIHYLFEQ